MVRSSFAAIAAALLLAAGAHGQGQRHLRRVTKPIVSAELDLVTGTYTIGPRVRRKAGSFNTSRTLSNLDFSGFVGIDSVQCEWFDVADKGQARTGKQSQIMTSFLFAYCSFAQSTTSGGVGGSATISFVEGYETPVLGTPRPSFASRTAVFNLSGMPAFTSGGWSQNFSCYVLRVETGTPSSSPGCLFEGGIPLADGPLGWAWDFRDVVPGFPPLAATFPFLACVTSCSGPGPDGQTMTDGMDKYCGLPPNSPPFTLVSTFTFGTTTTMRTITSLGIEIREANAIASADELYNPAGASPPNPVILNNVSPAVLGATLVNSLDCSAASAAKPAIFRYEFRPGNVAPFTLSAAIGNVLVSLSASDGRNIVVPSHGMGTVAPPLPLPVDLQFLNAAFQVQGFCGDAVSGFLSNARNQVAGSF